jgi:hypothetical protein
VKLLAKYILKYWFEHGGTCLWSINDLAKTRFSYAITNEDLPISKSLSKDLDSLETEYHSYLNWDDPTAPSPWTPTQKIDFNSRANKAYLKLLSELGPDFEVINAIDSCIVCS